MSVVFPNIPLYQGWGAPLRIESDIKDLELVQGSLPKELVGALYKCGPDRQYPPMLKDDIFIDGEGMVHMFRCEGGEVSYRSRWVRTERFVLQEQARRSLFGRYRNRYTNDPSVAGKNQGTANTNVVWHGRKLLILKEDSLPTQIDPQTLATTGEWNYGGAWQAVSMTAHPKLDFHTNELLTFSYQARGDCTKDFAFYVIDADGKVAHEMWFEMPYPGMVHDFAVTDTHIIVPFFPLITDLDVLKKGGPFYQWHPDKGSFYAVFPRRGKTSEVRWFRGPTVSAGHMMNAYNDGSLLHLDLCLYRGNCFDFFPSYDGSPFKPAPPQLTRLTFDLAGKQDGCEIQLLVPTPGEMPKCDDRYIGKPYRYGYMICRPPNAKAGDIGMGGIGRYDHRTKELVTWAPGNNFGVHEPTFVPRQPGAPEGDGFLLVIVNRFADNRSDLVVLDAQHVERGPLATLQIPVRVRTTFHGMWAPEKALRTGRFEA
jgi:carotenoid cleavage dioxygenase-like enzyme